MMEMPALLIFTWRVGGDGEKVIGKFPEIYWVYIGIYWIYWIYIEYTILVFGYILGWEI